MSSNSANGTDAVVSTALGLETEYGILGASKNPVQLSSLVVAAYKATQQGRVAPWDYAHEDPLMDARGFHLDRAAAHPSLLTDSPGKQAGQSVAAVRAPLLPAPDRNGPGAALLTNGARLYVDHAHPEYATPETASAREVALWDKAGEQVMAAAVQAATEAGTAVSLFKNNTDGQGASYGTHENYLLPRALIWEGLVAGITPFLVTRQVYTGSGRVGLGTRSQEPGFQLSQRADFVEAEVGLETTLNRPIVNTRDEPHAEPSRWRRLHVIVGDATMMEVATYVRLGVTALVLRAWAQAAPAAQARLLDQVSLEAPVAAFQQVSRDITLETKLALVGGTAARALDIQHRYRDFTAQVLGDLGGEERDLLERWSALLDGLEVDPHSVARQVEWVAKLQVLEALRARRGDSWAAPALRALDLQWTQVGGENPLFRRLENRGGVELLFSDAEVAAAVTEPPTSTRAYLKGQTLARFPEAVATAGWDSLTLVDASKPGRSGVVRVALPDPLGANQYQVGALLRQANSAHELEELLTQAGLT